MKIKVAALGALVPMLAYVAPSFAAPTAEAGPPNLYSSTVLVSGLSCDGVTDDRAAWVAAFNMALSKPYGAIVEMPASCWSYISSTISVTLPGNKVLGIRGQGSDLSKIIVAAGQDGFNFTYSSSGNYLQLLTATGTALKLAGFTIIRNDSSSASANTAINVTADTIAGTQPPASSVDDLVFSGITKGTGWANGLSYTDVSNLSIRGIRYYGGYSSGNMLVINGGAGGSTLYSVDTHISDAYCEQAYACVTLNGQVQGTFISDFTFANINYGVIANGLTGSYGQPQNLVALDLGHISALKAGVSLVNSPFFSISHILFLAADTSLSSTATPFDIQGGYNGTISGNNIYMTQGGSSNCGRIRSGAYRVVVTGNTCDFAADGFSTEDTAADNTIIGNSVNDILGTAIADSGHSNVIGPNNINGVRAP